MKNDLLLFSEPMYGWTRLLIGGCLYGISYLCDPIIDTANAIASFYKNKRPITIIYDCEGYGDIRLKIGTETSVVYYYNNEFKLYTTYVKYDINNIYKGLMNSYDRFKDKWIMWNIMSDEDDVKEREENLQKCIENVKDVKDKYDSLNSTECVDLDDYINRNILAYLHKL